MRKSPSLRAVVACLVVLSAAYSLMFVDQIARTAERVLARVNTDPSVVAPLAVACVGIIFGHAIRALRGKVMFGVAASTTVPQQFGAFSVGSLCNVVLPFRLGELVRADALAQVTHTSLSFSFAFVLLERLFDAGILMAVFAAFGHFSLQLLCAFVLLAALVWLLWRPPSWFKRAISGVAGVLEEGYGTRFLFRFWTVEYGLRRALTARRLAVYALLSVANWAVYVAAMALFLSPALGIGALDALSASASTFVALTTSAAPGALGSFTPTLASFGLSDPTSFIMAWCAATIPTCVIGLLWAAFGLRSVPLFRLWSGSADGAVQNKLTRDADISESQATFLRDYYRCSPLAERISRDDMEGTASVSRYFTGGGSAAVTYLSQRGDRQYVTKRVQIGKEQSLREQYDWLRRHACRTIAGVSEEREDELTYSIDIAFDLHSVDGFDWVHSCSEAQARRFVEESVQTLADEVWGPVDSWVAVAPDEGDAVVADYVHTHVRKCMDLAVSSLPSLSAAMEPDTLLINGVEHANLRPLLEELERNREAMRELASFRTCDEIHGDLIVDNIIWSRDKGCPVLLDPVPCGNCFCGPVFDFGKLSQSLQIGYEFALRDRGRVALRADGSGVERVIEYGDRRSERYEMLWRYVYDELAPRYLTDVERRTVLFIGATNYFRRMKHQAVQCPDNALKFYALGVRYLDEWMGLYR